MTELDMTLEPCPFCGGQDLVSEGDDKIVGYRCRTCEATGPNHYDSRFDWNRRASTTSAGVTEEQTQTALHNAKVLIRALSGPDDAIAQACIAEIEAALEASRVAPVSQKEAEPVADDAPERLWLSAADDDNEHDVWFDPDEGGSEYVRADLAGAVEPWEAQAKQAVSVIAMIRAMIGEMFGSIGNLESEEATLLRGPEAKHDGEAILAALQNIAATIAPAPAVEPVGIKALDTCQTCQGNGEIVTDWDTYLHGDDDEHATAECPDCNGIGKVSPTPVSAPVGVVEELIREAIDLLKEKKYGNPARSPGHNARLMLEDALAALRSPAVEGK